MSKKHWQSFSELNQTERFQQAGKDEFEEELPFESADKGALNSITPRRDFLKYLGFTTTAAAIAASCEIPVKKAIPFANKPEDIIPGVANFYATTFVEDGDAVSVLAKVRDGRPIKIEGNELSPLTQGGTSARVQASVLDLYDTARLRYPLIDKKEVTLEAIDKSVGSALAGLGGAPIVILTSTVTSPTTKEVIKQFISKYPGSRHVMYDAVSCTGMLLANEASYGKRAIPFYHFDKAKTIVSIGADFLGTWINPVAFAKQYSRGRKIDEKNPAMSKHIQFESVLSLTGANADKRYLHRPSETGAIALALMNAVNGQSVSGISDDSLKAGIEEAAKELTARRGSALVVCGSNDMNIQLIVNSINNALGANGNTIDWSTTINSKQGIDADFARLLDDMNSGIVGALLIHGANPAYTWFDSDKVKNALKRVRVSVSFNCKLDETAQLCKYVIPDHHYLESWGDAEPASGHYSLIQPTIYPLFKTRQWQDSLLKWSATITDYLGFVKQYWVTKLGGETAWDKALQAGIIDAGNENAVAPSYSDTASAKQIVSTNTGNTSATPVTTGGAYNSAATASAATAITGFNKGGKTELYLYQNIAIGVGHGAGNPWLQELPDPITKATWDNYVMISPAMAKTLLDIDISKNSESDSYEVHPAKRVVKVTVNNKSIKLPVLIVPGIHQDTIGIALGYGRTKEIGKAAEGAGKNAFILSGFNGRSVDFINTNAAIEVVHGEEYDIAITQTHSSYDTPQGKRVEVMKELTLNDFKKHPNEIIGEREEELKAWGGLEKFIADGTLYPYYDKPGIHWGMSVDLNSCIGCGACVVACSAENNVPVVGKSEVKRFHEMHWLRIDRYYSGDINNPDVVFQPMLCQHCDNAPCENVCPVAATNHNSEGVNQMIYNRCIGTRYCANNCPYKVRRFNWADYTGADSFPDNQHQKGVGQLDPVVFEMNDDLTRMVLNPDVTVRSRGVIEKCSFCVQRTQEGKLKAKKESRPLKSGENNEWDVKTACQQACPTDAIMFGNANDSKSGISKHRVENFKRTFYSLEQIHTLPNVNYLAKVRNVEGGNHAEDRSEAIRD